MDDASRLGSVDFAGLSHRVGGDGVVMREVLALFSDHARTVLPTLDPQSSPEAWRALQEARRLDLALDRLPQPSVHGAANRVLDSLATRRLLVSDQQFIDRLHHYQAQTHRIAVEIRQPRWSCLTM